MSPLTGTIGMRGDRLQPASRVERLT